MSTKTVVPADEGLSEARAQAQAQWNANPCGAVEGDEYDREFFERVEKERYRQQYWQHDFFDYTSFAGKRVLEIGTGLGTDLKQFARNGADCHGLDITDRHLELTAKNFAAEGYPVTLRKGDATAIPFPDNHFDCVYSFGVIHHIPDVDDVVREIRRVLKPGGVFQVAVYHTYSIHTLALFGRALLKGQFFKLGIAGVLATIERGADGRVIKPYVKLYSRSGLATLLSAQGLAVEQVGVRQVHFESMRFLNSFRRFEKSLGWYVCARARKNAAP